ncbi:MAG: TIGR03435 family protein [Candidatus Sulfopaludibacter sp.]|nr:TIGR03435 family protein [Candidatus Sulfopaludibacter sp.]
MFKNSISAFGVCVAFAAASFAQAPAARLEFEVASVKPSEPVTQAMVASGKIHAGMKIDNARVDIGLMTMMQLITKAYDVKQYQVQGPDWMLLTPYDIVAKMPEGATKEQVPQMLQALLADRFKMTMHRDMKERPVYALVLAKGGSKMTPFKPDPELAANGAVSGSNEATVKVGAGSSTVSDGTGMQQKVTPSADGKGMHIEINKVSMGLLCEALFRFVGRPLVDMTNLKGDYNVTLDISMADIMAMQKAVGLAAAGAPAGGGGGDAARPADAASDNSGSSVVESLAALGLKMEPRKTPLEMLVIDHIEKTPTAN